MPDPAGLSRSHGQTRLKSAGGNAISRTLNSTSIENKKITHHPHFSQVIASAEDNLKEFEQRITELKTRGAALQADQMSTNKILKLQVINITDT